MFPFRTCQGILLGLLLVASPAFATRTHRAATSGHSHSHRHRRSHVVRGQRGIDPARATQIQDALIREHYLTGPASGEWDAATEAAMEKYQADHGWQTKLVPDSRALIKLGLGPHNDSVQSAKADSARQPAAQEPGATDSASSSNTALAGTLADAHTIQN